MKEGLRECSKVTGQELLLFNQYFRKELALGEQRKRRRKAGGGGRCGRKRGWGRGEREERRSRVGGVSRWDGLSRVNSRWNSSGT